MNDSLKIALPSDREIAMTRTFDAPRDLVFRCWTEADLVQRWLTGPEGWSFVVCEIDLRVGGEYRYVWRGPDGTDMGMRGVYREIARPERIVTAEIFDEDWTGGETLVTLELAEHDGRTVVKNTVLFASRKARDAALATGMADGVAAGFDRLDAFLRQQRGAAAPTA